MLIKFILSEAWPYLAAAAGVLAGLFYARQSGKAAGRNEADLVNIKATIRTQGKAREIDTEIDSLASDDLDSRGRRWVRDSKR